MNRIVLILVFLVSFLPDCVAQRFYFSAINSENGLPHNSVFSITQDHEGFIWFGTRDGISRFDSQRIKNYYLKAYDANVEATRINCLYAVGHELWVGTAVGLFRYRFDKDDFVQVPLGKTPVYVAEIRRISTGQLWVGSHDGVYILGQHGGVVSHILPGQNIHAICEFRKGSFLIAHDNAPRVINAEGETVVTPAIKGDSHGKTPFFREYTFLKNRQGTIWMSTENDLFQLDEKTMIFQPLDWFERLVKGRARVIRTVTEDQAGNVWIGSESGVVMVDAQRQETQWYDKSLAVSPYGLTDRAVYSSYVSRDGIVWLGTYFGGVNYTRPAGRSFEHLFAATGGQAIAGKAISQLAVDHKDRLWICTEDGGISIQDRATGQYTYHNRSNGLSDNNIHSICIDKTGVTWVGTFMGGLNRLAPASASNGVEEKRVYLHNPADPTSISDNGVYTIHRDRTNQLWVGTPRGLNLFDEKTGTFRLFKPDILGNTFVYEVRSDASGQIWIATTHSGIYRYEPVTDKLTHYDVANTPALRTNQISSIYEDSAHNVWFGSLNGGVCQWNDRQKTFIRHPVNDYLPNQTVYGILQDNQGIYWFSTNRGILAFDSSRQTYRVFDDGNGLQTTQFNFKSSLKDGRGHLYFGSVDGLCHFNPDVITKLAFDPPVYFTDLKLFNKLVMPDGKLMLTRRLDKTDELTFDYAQNVITLDFVAINYFSKHTSYYTYYLEGFEPTWRPKTTINSQTYTNLSPGNYTFHLRSFQSNGDLSPKEHTIRLVIKPPFWQSPYAYLLYLLLGIVSLLVYRRFITFMNHQKLAMQMERVEREKGRELNQQKLNFFTFLSNEFKTPITLIIAEIDELIQHNQAWPPKSATNYGFIKKNAHRLQSLIDQIAELRKTDNELQTIHLTDADIISFIKETLRDFDPLLRSRKICKRLTFSPSYLMASFDAGKLEMIIGNIFFYLTDQMSEGNELIFNAQIEPIDGQDTCQLCITFSVEEQPELIDGIRASYQFGNNSVDIFQQNNSQSIGILLMFSLLKMLSGTLSFSDNEQQRSLSLLISLKKTPVSKAVMQLKLPDPLSRYVVNAIDENLVVESNEASDLVDDATALKKPVLLIIDRSKDLTQFLKRHYQDTYRISVATTFDEAFKKAASSLPEVILCDNNLRNKENKSLCVALKNDLRTRHISVILLLDNQEDNTIIEGLNGGANGYISKPFNLKELDLMIINQLKSTSLLTNKLADGFVGSLLVPLPQRNKEQEFLLQFSALVNQQYKNKNVTVDLLAQLMNCSRSQLHTKLKTLTGLSTKEYLNDYRLLLAHQLLQTGMSIAEVAFEVGFGDPSYFSRAFKGKYGVTPSKAT